MMMSKWFARRRASEDDLLGAIQRSYLVELDAELRKVPPAQRAAYLRLIVQTIYRDMRSRVPGIGYYTTEARAFEPVVQAVETYCADMIDMARPVTETRNVWRFGHETRAASPVVCAVMLSELMRRFVALAEPGTPEADRLPPVVDAVAAYRATIEHDTTARTPKVA